MNATPCQNPVSILKNYVNFLETLITSEASISPASLNDAFINLGAIIGFSHVLYTKISLGSKDPASLEPLITNLPTEIANNLRNQISSHIEHQKWQAPYCTITTASEPSIPTVADDTQATTYKESIEHLTFFAPNVSGAIEIYAFCSPADKSRPSSISGEEKTAVNTIVNHFKHAKDYFLPALALKNAGTRPRKLLSSRENQILSLVAHGQTTAEISKILGITTKGVEFHLSSCKKKLNVKNRTHAVTKAVLMGILSSITWPTTVTTTKMAHSVISSST